MLKTLLAQGNVEPAERQRLSSISTFVTTAVEPTPTAAPQNEALQEASGVLDTQEEIESIICVRSGKSADQFRRRRGDYEDEDEDEDDEEDEE